MPAPHPPHSLSCGWVLASRDDLAIADCSRALELNPRDDAAYNNRGIAFKNKGGGPRPLPAPFSDSLPP
jgi:hypothetical protein